MKRFTLTLTVSNDYTPVNFVRKAKRDLAEVALEVVGAYGLDLVSVETKYGTVRKAGKAGS